MSSETIEASDESSLDELFDRYRLACPEVDAGPNFMPVLWQKIEARHGFWFAFVRFGRGALTASAALCLLLLVLNLASTPAVMASYTDAILAETSAEQTYYTEAIHTNPVPDGLTIAPAK
ncbi:MAG: hypothetical protein ACJ746_21195 [Bryobacteraceae bacterium]